MGNGLLNIGQARLLEMLKNDDALKGIDLGPVRRWSIIKTLSALGTTGIAELLELEEKKDNTTSGQRAAYAAKVARPLLDNKNHYWE